MAANVRHDSRVHLIDWSAREVCIRTGRRVYETTRVAVTLPLGVLKSGTVAFQPALPGATQRAIRRLAVGTLNKVVMVFRRRFWPKKADYFGCLSEGSEPRIDFWNLRPVTGEPILAGLIGGRAALKLEQMSAGDIRDLVLRPLRRAFRSAVEEPLALQATRWASDPFARGGYSYVPLGGSYDDYEALALPVGNRPFLAGEATNVRYPSTVHGAYASGERAAQQILRA